MNRITFFILYTLLCNIYSHLLFRYFKSLNPIRTKPWIFYLTIWLVNPIAVYCSTLVFYPFQMAVVFIFGLAIGTIFFNTSFQRVLFSAAIYIFILLSAQGIVNAVNAILLDDSFYNIFHAPIDESGLMVCISIVVAIVFFLLLTIFFSKNKILNAINNTYVLSIFTSVLTLLCGLMAASTFVYYVDSSSRLIPIYHLLLTLMFFITYIIFFFYYINLDFTTRLQIETQRLKNQLDTQKNHYKKNIEYIQELRKVKHDYLDLLHSLEYAFIDYSKEELQNMITEMLQKTKEIDMEYTQYSNHPLIDSIILDAVGILKSKNVEFSSLISIPEHFVLNDDDVCFIFASLLNISITLVDLESGHRSVDLTNKISSNWVILLCTIKTHATYDEIEQILSENAFSKIINITEDHGGFIENEYNQQTHKYQIKLCLPK